MSIEDGGRRCEHPDHAEAFWNVARRANRTEGRVQAPLPAGYLRGHIAERAEQAASATDPGFLTTVVADTTAVRLAVVGNPATPQAVLEQLRADAEQPRAVKRAVRKVLRQRRAEALSTAGQDAVFRPAPVVVVEAEPAPAMDAAELAALDAA